MSTAMSTNKTDTVLRWRDVQINGDTVTKNSEVIRLTPTELKIIKFLLNNPGRVYTRERLIDEARGHDVYVEPKTVNAYVAALRRKLGTEIVETVRCAGFTLGDE